MNGDTAESHPHLGLLSEDALHMVDSAFTLFTMQRGPILSMVSFLEFLGTVAGSIGLPEHRLTAQHVDVFVDCWDPVASEERMSRQQCRDLTQRLVAFCDSDVLSAEASVDLFHQLCHGTEALPVTVLRSLLRALVVIDSPPSVIDDSDFADAEVEAESGERRCRLAIESLGAETDTVPLADFVQWCESDLWLSMLLHRHAADIRAACDMNPMSAHQGSPSSAAGEANAADVPHLLHQAIVSGRAEHYAQLWSQRRAAGGGGEGRGGCGGHLTASSVYYPTAVALTDGVGHCTDQAIHPVAVRAVSAVAALHAVSQNMTSQALTKRVADLRKLAAAAERRRQQALAADIAHAAYEAVDLAPLGVPRGSHPNILRAVDLVGVGERAGERLHPHNESPLESIKCRLRRTLGVALEVGAEKVGPQTGAGPGVSPSNACRLQSADDIRRLQRMRVDVREDNMLRHRQAAAEATRRRLASEVPSGLQLLRMAPVAMTCGDVSHPTSLAQRSSPLAQYRQQLERSRAAKRRKAHQNATPSSAALHPSPLPFSSSSVAGPAAASKRLSALSDLNHELSIMVVDARDVLQRSVRREW